jgi:FixJ family two-component response regulator
MRNNPDINAGFFFLTGNGDIPMSVRAIKQGAVDFLTKPVNDSDLIAAIHDAIEKNRIARQARATLSELQQLLAIADTA